MGITENVEGIKRREVGIREGDYPPINCNILYTIVCCDDRRLLLKLILIMYTSMCGVKRSMQGVGSGATITTPVGWGRGLATWAVQD
jgi:hypothetical protein